MRQQEVEKGLAAYTFDVEDPPRIAILIPCYNESVTIEKVIADFHRELPTAQIYVYDNNSSDETATLAHRAGATVIFEKRQGKGFVVGSMFRDLDADVYVLVDGDDTYPADRVHDLIRPILEARADMVVGNRLVAYGDQSFRPLHVFGNVLVAKAINCIFGCHLRDIMSGYRAFSAEFVKSIPIVSKAFEIETELTLQALYRNFIIQEVPLPYRKRPQGSYSKLRTYRDGCRVLLKIVNLFKAYRPLLFFSILAGILACVGLIVASIPSFEFTWMGQRRYFPSAVLASAIELVAVVAFFAGLILDSINHHFREVSQLMIKLALDRKQFLFSPPNRELPGRVPRPTARESAAAAPTPSARYCPPPSALEIQATERTASGGPQG